MPKLFRTLVFAVLLCTLPALAKPALCDDIALFGAAEQGGMVFGQVVPGTQLAIDGEPVITDQQGRFVIGFGRNHGNTSTLVATLPSGAKTSQTITVAKRDWKVQRIDGLPPRKVTPSEEDYARIKDDNAQIAAVRKNITRSGLFWNGFLTPVEGRVSGVFGSQRILNGEPRSPHSGLDIAAPKGTPVKAAAAGDVALVHPDMFYSGKSVMIDHGMGVSTIYIHMDSISVKQGDFVNKGDFIGTVGSTGRATGPHLHFGVSWKNHKLDPETILKTGRFYPKM